MNTKLRVQEKAVSTDSEWRLNDPNDYEDGGYRVHHILAALVNRKVISIKAGICETKLKWRIQPKLLVDRLAEKNSKNKRKLGRRKGRCAHSCHKHHHHNRHHHHQHRHDLDHRLFHHHHHHCDGVVRHDEGSGGRSEEWPQNQRPAATVPYLGGHILTAALRRSTAGMSEGQQRHAAERPAKARPKRKHRKTTTRFGDNDERRNATGPRQQVPAAVVHPDDLPQRARWTIIITAGLLLVTCMLLVGVTLRMAPVIDELVRNQNEELMNSLDREEFGPSENSTDYNMYR